MVESLIRRAIARGGAVRAVVKSPPVQHAIQTGRGTRAVRERWRFLLGQLVTGRASAYHLRSSGQTVVLRHRSKDVHILNEIHSTRIYDFPPEASEALRARGEAPTILDLGGNIGLFTLLMLDRFPRARITALEPDPANAALFAHALRLSGADSVVLREAAAAASDGELRFAAGHHYHSHVAQPGEDAIVVPAVDAFALARGADFVKIDIEGAEWELLLDPRLRELDAALISLEWHAHLGCPAPEPERAAVAALEAAGYEVRRDAVYDGICGTLWAWRSHSARGTPTPATPTTPAVS